MKPLILESEVAQDLAVGCDTNGYVYIANNFVGEWRWGVNYELVIKDSAGNYWATVYQEQTGDNYHNSLEDNSAHFYPVVPEEKVITTYKRVK